MSLKQINQYWREGHFVDLWSINHFLSGVVLASIIFHFDISFTFGMVIAFILFVGWEVAEVALGIKEHAPNMAMDVVCDFAGFLLLSYYLISLGNPLTWWMTLGSITLFMIFNIWGFFAYEVRKIEKL